jgi:hypothetical protein
MTLFDPDLCPPFVEKVSPYPGHGVISPPPDKPFPAIYR